jgi:soluble lytic murein transglycosylase-like protein
VGVYEWHGLSTLIHPVAKSTVIVNRPNFLRESLIYLQCPRQTILSVENGITIATAKTGIGGLLLASLLYTESNFRTTDISHKGYRGIAQTPTATMIYPEVDILHGAMILKEKLHLAKGNMLTALQLYKGGRNPEARKQANNVMVVYNNLIRRAERTQVVG